MNSQSYSLSLNWLCYCTSHVSDSELQCFNFASFTSSQKQINVCGTIKFWDCLYMYLFFCFLVYLTTFYQLHRLYRINWHDSNCEWWTGKDVQGSSGILSQWNLILFILCMRYMAQHSKWNLSYHLPIVQVICSFLVAELGCHLEI